MGEHIEPPTGDVRWRKAVVTGASSGIGEAFVGRLASGGVDVIAVGRDRERTHAVARRLTATGRVEPLVADLSTEDGVRAVQAYFESPSEPPIDLLINCAGFGVTAPFAEVAESRHIDVLAVNVMAVVRLSHTASQRLPRGGAILNVSSIGGFRPVAGSAVYAAAKTFVNNFSLAIGEEFRDRGISVVCVCPGYTDTRFMATARGTPVSKLAIPEDIWQTADEVAEVSLAALADNEPDLVLTSEGNGESTRRALAKNATRISVRSPKSPLVRAPD
jgi:uncharacterized protein